MFYIFSKTYFSYIALGHFKLSNSLFEPSSELQVACFTYIKDKLNGILIVYTAGITTYTFLLELLLYLSNTIFIFIKNVTIL